MTRGYGRDVPAVDVVRRGLVAGAELDALQAWVSTVEQWPAGSHVWGHYAEQTEHGPKICRTENVSACHTGIATLVEGDVRACASDAFGEPAEAFKDKINYKHPGGAGFSPHQDLVAYPGVKRVMSILIAIDACSVDAGCLWLAAGVDRVLPTDERGAVSGDIASDLEWFPAELDAGDAVCIDGVAPHYSQPNRSPWARRVLVVSYAPPAENYRRDDYYEARAATMQAATEGDGRFRISTLADFEGREVPTGPTPASCTHP
jgi:hypothetical protein